MSVQRLETCMHNGKWSDCSCNEEAQTVRATFARIPALSGYEMLRLRERTNRVSPLLLRAWWVSRFMDEGCRARYLYGVGKKIVLEFDLACLGDYWACVGEPLAGKKEVGA